MIGNIFSKIIILQHTKNAYNINLTLHELFSYWCISFYHNIVDKQSIINKDVKDLAIGFRNYAYPQRICINKIKFHATTQVEFLHNFKLLQNSFLFLGIDKKIQITKLVKCKNQDNLQFVQWLKWYLGDIKHQDHHYALKRRQFKNVQLNFIIYNIIQQRTDYGKDCIHDRKSSKYAGYQRDPIKQMVSRKKKRKYELNDQFLDIYQSRTDQSGDEQNQLIRVLSSKGRISYQTKNNSTSNLLHPNLKQSQPCSTQCSSKQNAQCIIRSSDLSNASCKYKCPTEIKKFFFPPRFSQRLVRRVDLISKSKKNNKRKGQNNEYLLIEDQEDQIESQEFQYNQIQIVLHQPVQQKKVNNFC